MVEGVPTPIDRIRDFVHEQSEISRGKPQDVEFIHQRNRAKHQEAMEAAPLVPGEGRIRINSAGEIYIRSFKDLTEKEMIEGTEAEITETSKKRKVEIIWSKHPTVESAIKSVDTIAGEYDQSEGEQVIRLRNLMTTTKDLRERYARNEIRPDELESVLEEMATSIVQAKLDRVVKPNKIAIKNRLLRSVTRDRLGRPNPSRSRLLIAHAEEDMQDELDFTELVDNKYIYVGHLLRRFRNDQRGKLRRIADHAELITRMPADSREFDRALDLLFADTREDLSPMNTFSNPYALPAHQARLLIFGNVSPLDKLTLEAFTRGEQPHKLSPNEVRSYLNQLPIAEMTSRPRAQRQLSQVSAELNSVLYRGAVALGEEEPVRLTMYGRQPKNALN